MRHNDSVARHKHTPNIEAVKTLITRGAWADLACILGFPNAGDIPILPEIFSCWGIPDECVAGIREMRGLATCEGFRLVLLDSALCSRQMRQLMLGVHRFNPCERVMWWHVSDESVTLAVVDTRKNGELFIRTLTTPRMHPSEFVLQKWVAMQPRYCVETHDEDSATALHQHVCDVLNQETLTRQFFREFCAAQALLVKNMQHGPQDSQDRHDVALITLLRLIFMYFLQQKEALEADRRFVLRHLKNAQHQKVNFYRQILRPLFFGVLNQPQEIRCQSTQIFASIPFLNGGLFEPIPAEIDCPELCWENAIWHQVIEELFENYQFTSQTIDSRDEALTIDPEMLGKVFEGLMASTTRTASGSYYTPRDIVQQMVRSALVGYFSDHSTLQEDALKHIVEGHDVSLSCKELDQLRNALKSVRILDPAVGTGAFLLESFHALARCYEVLYAKESSANAYAHARALIHTHLFGVDIHPTAVRLCELRLWLTLLDRWPEREIATIEPLPNLSHRIATGNSLVDPVELSSQTVQRNAGQQAGWVPAEFYATHRKSIENIRSLQSSFLIAHGEEKKQICESLRTSQRKLKCDLLEARLLYLEAKKAPFQRAKDSKNLFDEPNQICPSQKRLLKNVNAEIQAVGEALEALVRERSDRLMFSYMTHFAEVLSQGGFDLIITNPPWVREQRIERSIRHYLKARYCSYQNQLWPDARRLGIKQPYGSQVDLASLFMERSLELLRPGGRLCALVPSKLFRSLHGASLRAKLAQHRLIGLEDFSEASRQMFEATTYPTILHVQKSTSHGGSSTSSMRFAIWRGDTREEWTTSPREIYATGQHPSEPWLFVEPEIRAIFEKISKKSRPLGSIPEIQPRRGLFTGCNSIFVHSKQKVFEMLGKEARQWSRPVLQGRDIREGTIEPGEVILWPYDTQGNCLPELPEVLQEYFCSYREKLLARSDHRDEHPLWQMFRVCPQLHKPKVVWRDISMQLEASFAPAHIVPLNTVYYISCESEAEAHQLVTLMNSEPVRAMAFALAERARGGWRRHFSWVIRMLPVPEAPAQDCSEGLFGLDEHEIQTLHQWRTGQNTSCDLAA